MLVVERKYKAISWLVEDVEDEREDKIHPRGRFRRYGWTPLHKTCYDGHVQVMKELREHEVDIEA
jgi:hypothetical protein